MASEREASSTEVTPPWAASEEEWERMRRAAVRHALGAPARHRRRRAVRAIRCGYLVWDLASVGFIGAVVGAIAAVAPYRFPLP